MTEYPKDEGARSFARFLEHVDEGGLNVNASKALVRLMKILQNRAALTHTDQRGAMIVKLAFNVSDSGIVDVAYQLETKEPKAKHARSVFHLTAGGNLSLENPRQMTMQLRDVNQKTTVIDEHGEVMEVVQP